MKIFVHLREPENDDFSGVYETDYPDESLDNLVFMYSEGNYRCDCNRALFLYNYRGFTDPYATQAPLTDNVDRECIAENNIVIDKIVDEHGNLLYSEGNEYRDDGGYYKITWTADGTRVSEFVPEI